MKLAYKRVLVTLPTELLEEVDQAAKNERRQRSEFVREALRDRISRASLTSSLAQLRTQAKNNFTEEEIDHDIEAALVEFEAEPGSSL